MVQIISGERFADIFATSNLLIDDGWFEERIHAADMIASMVVDNLEKGQIDPIHSSLHYRKAADLLMTLRAFLDAVDKRDHSWVKMMNLKWPVGYAESLVRDGVGPEVDLIVACLTWKDEGATVRLKRSDVETMIMGLETRGLITSTGRVHVMLAFQND